MLCRVVSDRALHPKTLPGMLFMWPVRTTTSSEMLFALPEYDRAAKRFIFDAISELARAHSPILSMIRREPVEGGLGSQFTTESGEQVELPAREVVLEQGYKLDDVIRGDFGGVLESLDGAGQQEARTLVPMLFENLRTITKATGMVVESQGGPTPEAILEMIDKMDIAFDEHDEPRMPSVVAHPDTVAKMPPWLPEHQKRLDEILDRKREERDARRRHRKLS